MSKSKRDKNRANMMSKLAAFIVDKRNLIFLITLIGLIFSLFSRNWVVVERELTNYLPANSETKIGIDIMNEQFVTYGTARIMVTNITQEKADSYCEQIRDLSGVQTVSYDAEENFRSASALYAITFDYPSDDEACLVSLDLVKNLISSEDYYVSTELGNALEETLHREIMLIMAFVAVIVLGVLCLTSETWAEIPVLILTFGIAMILNMGTNFLLGTISFVSNSVTSILQLALSLDYAVILCNRFKEEHRVLPIHDSVVLALEKGIPEIGASSLTTIGGLVAMLFMQFGIGPDMAVCLIKAILFSLLSVFLIMPGLLILFGPLMDRTHHGSFLPKIPAVGRIAYRTRYVVPPIFLILVIVAFRLSSSCPFAYGYSSLVTPKLNETQIADQMISSTFDPENYVAVVLPAGNYDAERLFLNELDTMEQVKSSTGMSNAEAMDGYMLADKLNPRQFAELTDLDFEAAKVVYAAYAAQNEEYGQILGNISGYKVPLVDMLLYVCDQVDSGIVDLDLDTTARLQDARVKMESAKAQLQGKDKARVLVYLNLPTSGDETYDFLDTIRQTAEKYYPNEDIYVVGQSSNERDFKHSYSVDNIVVTVVSILIVLVVLLFTFKSAGMPILLILVIQGAIWLNFTIPSVFHDPIFFLSYMIVSSIQMGANIDYAIVIASRFQELKMEMDHEKAIVETMNFAFPTIVTSGTVLSMSGILIGRLTSDAAISGVGYIGQGTIISMILVMFVLPQMLLLGSKLVDRTSFSIPHRDRTIRENGRVFIEGMVHGRVNGTITGAVSGYITGDVNVNVISGTVAPNLEANIDGLPDSKPKDDEEEEPSSKDEEFEEKTMQDETIEDEANRKGGIAHE